MALHTRTHTVTSILLHKATLETLLCIAGRQATSSTQESCCSCLNDNFRLVVGRACADNEAKVTNSLGVTLHPTQGVMHRAKVTKQQLQGEHCR